MGQQQAGLPTLQSSILPDAELLTYYLYVFLAGS